MDWQDCTCTPFQFSLWIQFVFGKWQDSWKFYLLAWYNTAKQAFVKWITLRSRRKLVNKACGCHHLNYLSAFFFFFRSSSEAQGKMRTHPKWACLFKAPLMKCYFFSPLFLAVSLSGLLGEQALIQHVMICVVWNCMKARGCHVSHGGEEREK